MKFQKLYVYQENYIRDMPSRYIMSADVGTGKSAMSLVHYSRTAFPNPLLILAPASKVRTGDWQRDLTEIFEALGMPEPEYEIYSYESFSRRADLWHRFSPQHGGKTHAIIADECHKFANSQSKIGKAMFAVAKDSKFFIGLSGTPMPNSWESFQNYAKIFSFVKNITEFKRKYCEYASYLPFPKIIGYKNEKELIKYWQSISKRLPRSEAHQLPDKQIIGKSFLLPMKYKNMLKNRKTEDGELLDNPSKLAHALRQSLTPIKKEFIAEFIQNTEENIVVFYNYDIERDMVLGCIPKNKTVFEQNGHKHTLPKKDEWDEIKNSITLAHYKSGATGVEMTYATIAIYISPTYSYSEFIQSMGRIHRNGQKKKTLFYCLRVKDSIEDHIYECLRTKVDFSEKQWVKDLK
jgi:superfamily II DNA or RNA helicase